MVKLIRMKPIICKTCLKPGHYKYQCFLNRKPIKQIGKKTLTYNKWRDTVAIPYLTSKYGYRCALCGATEALDVDHILKRGSHPELKMSLANIRYLCRDCHIKET